MINKIFLIVLGILIAGPVLAASASDISLVVSAADINAGTKLNFNYTITNKSSSALKVTIVPFIKCQNAGSPLLANKDISLNAKQVYQGNYQGSLAGKLEPGQKCLAYLKVISPFKLTVVKPFSIINLPSLSVAVNSSGSATCPATANSFALNTTCMAAVKNVFDNQTPVMLNPVVNQTGATVSATLTLPNGTRQAVSLPYFFIPSQVGSYQLMVKVTKTGYLPVSQISYFSVIPKLMPINIVSARDINVGAKNSVSNGVY